MKILATSDIHNDLRFCAEIVTKAIENEVDVIVISGDLTNFGTQEELQLVVKNLDCGIPYVFAGGNHDSCIYSTKFAKFLKKYSNFFLLRDSYVTIDGVKFYGSPYTIRFKNWWFMEKESCMPKHLPKEECDIMICHQPISHEKISYAETAFGFADLGCQAYNDFIEKSKIKHYITGHVHERGGGEALIGNTQVYNCAGVIKIINV